MTIKISSIEDVVSSGLCLGCGICAFDEAIGNTVYDKSRGQFIPNLRKGKVLNNDLLLDICPGKGYKIIEWSSDLYGKNKYSVDLGFYDKLYASRTSDEKILQNASSGGVMISISLFLLERKYVDKVIVTKFIYTEEGPRTLTFSTNSKEELLSSQGSKYCPVDISEVIKDVLRKNERVAFIGTPCQIAGLRGLQKINTKFNDNLVFTIANFCGGFKSYNNIKKLAQRSRINYNKIKLFRFRGGGQPGSMFMEDEDGNRKEIPYPLYVGKTGISKHLRCHLCVDAMGELADFSCGDAWLEKYIKDIYPWSFIITRNSLASKIILEMGQQNLLISLEVPSEEILASQKSNLTSKKTRYIARNKIYNFWRYSLPMFDGGYQNTQTSLTFEMRVFFLHKIKLIIESLGLFRLFLLIKQIKRSWFR